MGTTEKRTKKSGAGRPLKELDKQEFEKLCFLQCTINEICAWFGIDDKTLNKWCKKNYKANFSEVFSQKRKNGLISLRRTQFQLAETSPAMAIFLGKNLLGQTDKVEETVKGDTDRTINITFTKPKEE